MRPPIAALIAATLGLSLLGTGDLRAPVAAVPPSGQAAVPLRAALPDLAAARFAVYLPDRLPTAPPGQSYLITAHSTPGTYEVTVHFTNTPTPINGNGMSSWSSYIGLVRGGPSAWVLHQADTRDGAAITVPAGTPQPVTLPGGIVGQAYAAGAVLWQEGGWRYAAYGDGPTQTLQTADSMARMFLPSGNPVGPGTSGDVVRDFGADGGNSAVIWTAGTAAYEVWGRDTAAFTLAQDLARVRP